MAEAIAGGQDDQDTPPRNATVYVSGPNGNCSGSLITSTLVLTAAHCAVVPGAAVWVGPQHPNASIQLPPPNNPQARAVRTVTDVWSRVPPSVYNAGGSPPIWAVARDVAILRLDFPVTMDASPLRPSMIRPALSSASGLSFATFAGGIAGYGLKYTTAGGNIVSFSRNSVRFTPGGAKSFIMRTLPVGTRTGQFPSPISLRTSSHSPKKATQVVRSFRLYREARPISAT